MGVVYAAYDPELDRKLAIKLIRVDVAEGERAQARLLREAQAMARVAHPNVIAVYDVGTVAGQISIAMEFVAGPSLGRWLARLDHEPCDSGSAGSAGSDQPRWARVLAVFRQAGQGLAAAHEAGLVHRDFKPENVLVGDDGRVRVLDFGLARGLTGLGALSTEGSDSEGSGGEGLDGQGRGRDLEQGLTDVGALLGTPAYMPPERLFGEPNDARSDQFSFCVALWEGLYGERPFRGETLHALFDAIAEHDLQPPPRARAELVPEWLHAALERGLSSEPKARFPDMRALLEALQPPEPRARRGLVAGAVVACAMVIVGSVVGLSSWGEPETPICGGLDGALVGIWDEDRAAALRASFVASELAYAQRSAELAVTGLDRWRRRWLGARTAACEATHLRGEQSAQLLDLRMACLDGQLAEVDALVGLMLTGDAGVVERSSAIIGALEGPARCADGATLGRTLGEPRDPGLRLEVAELDDALTQAQAQFRAGAFKDAAASLEALRAAVAETRWPALQGRLARLDGKLLAELRDSEGARAAHVEGYVFAHRAGDPRGGAEALVDLLWTLRYDPKRRDEMGRWSRVARAELETLDDPLLAGRMHIALGTAAWEAAEYERAIAEYQTALDIRLDALEPGHLAVLEARKYLADTRWRSDGDFEAARLTYLEVRAAYSEALGPEHPEISEIDMDIGGMAWMSGDYDAAREGFEAALRRLERVFGPDDVRLSNGLGNIGACYAMEERYDEARPYLARSLSTARAAADFDHVQVAITLGNLAELEYLVGDYERARPLYEEAYAVRLEALGPDHPDTARSLIHLGKLALATGDPESAREHLERAVALRRGDVQRELRAEAQWRLAEALHALGEDGRVPELIRAARADYEASGVGHEGLSTEFEAAASTLESAL